MKSTTVLEEEEDRETKISELKSKERLLRKELAAVLEKNKELLEQVKQKMSQEELLKEQKSLTEMLQIIIEAAGDDPVREKTQDPQESPES